jgi:putative flippase GtrA
MGRWQRCLEIGRNLADRHQTKVRFLLAGALNTAIGLAVYPALYFLAAPLKLHYLTILVISQVVCVTFAFLTNKFLVFRTSGNYLRESGKFVTFHLSYFLVNLAALPALVELVGMHPVWAQTLFAVLVIVTSYFWHSRITFSSTKVTR